MRVLVAGVIGSRLVPLLGAVGSPGGWHGATAVEPDGLDRPASMPKNGKHPYLFVNMDGTVFPPATVIGTGPR
jgi:hypothetical protein